MSRAAEPGEKPLPPPNAARYNEWQDVAVAPATAFVPHLGVSVVMSYYEQPAELACALAGLERQSYPRDLIEVIVVDDGSRTPPAPPPCPLDVRVVRHADRGYGLARARNRGARAARAPILVFLDGDTVAEPDLVRAHARWHHAVADAVTLGFRRWVDIEPEAALALLRRSGTLADRIIRPAEPWLQDFHARTRDFTSRRDDLFRAMVGGNFAIGKAFYEAVGGTDESFTRYGEEDREFAYRAQACGALLVPVRDASAWHLGKWEEDRARKRSDRHANSGKLANLVAHRGFRSDAPGRIHAVPRRIVTLVAGHESAARAADAVEEILADPAGDVVVRLETSIDAPPAELRWLEEYFESDPRVRIAPLRSSLDEFPASPVHARVPASWRCGPHLLSRLIEDLGDGASATRRGRDGSEATIACSWALHRARRTGRPVSDFGDATTLGGDAANRAALGWLAAAWRAKWRRTELAEGLRLVAGHARIVRGPRSALRFARWLTAGIARRSGAKRDTRRSATPPRIRELRRPGGSLDPPSGSAGPGAKIEARGPRAAAVFAASRRAAAGPGEHGHVDVVLADTGTLAAAAAPALAVVLDTAPGLLAVPGLDPLRWNPVGWAREADEQALALGPVEQLPGAARPAMPATLADRRLLRYGHHLEDTAAFHTDPLSRAAALVRVAATGLPVRLADGGPGLEALLGPELYALMTLDIAGADAAEREALSIRTRRAALRTHSLGARARQVCEAAGLDDPPTPPSVSILLPTRRPGLLHWALANVARQSYPNLELVLALHGDGFAAAAVQAALGRFAFPVKVVRVDAERPLGTVLNAGTAAAAGVLVTKMDDDDLYGAEHVWDLVLAREYTGATLVGKRSETVYLADTDRTLSCFTGGAERDAAYLNGGCMLIGRGDLAHIGGWRRVPVGEDQGLIEDVAEAGGRVYRTHGAGYVLIRHGVAHTWPEGSAHYRARHNASRGGWCPALAGIDEPLPPRPAARAFAREAAS